MMNFLCSLAFLSSLCSPSLGALSIFTSSQVGATPTNGYVLQTNGTNSTWVATSTLGFGSGSSNTFSYPLVDTAGLVSLAFGTTTTNIWSNLQTFTSGISINGETVTDFTGTGITIVGGALTASGGSGSGNVATSSAETATYVPFWTSTAGTPALLSGGESTFTYDSTLNKLTVSNASTTNLTTTNATTTAFYVSGTSIYGVEGGTSLLKTPTATTVDTAGGSFSFLTGNGFLDGSGGNFLITTGNGGATGAGGSINLFGGNSGATSGSGGEVRLQGGTGKDTLETGGNIVLAPGVGTTGATNGTVRFENPSNLTSAIFNLASITADRTFTLPNATGTFCLTSTCASSATYPVQLSSGVVSLAFGTTTSNTWADTQTFGNTSATNATTTTAVNLSAFTSALLQTDAEGDVAEYAGTSCTNQFVRSISALGIATCATVGASDVSLANLTATDTTLTFSGTYNGSTARTIGLNLGNANIWTALQTFAGNGTTTFAGGVQAGTLVGAPYFNATSTTATSTFSGGLYLDGGGMVYDYTSNNVGIGTTSPQAKLVVSGGDIHIDQTQSIKFMRAANYTAYNIITTPTQGGGNSINFGQSTGFVQDFNFINNSGTALTIKASGATGIGTTTPQWKLQIASSTQPQLALSDASITSDHWTFRSIAGSLYIATASPTTYGTSSVSAISIATSGMVTFVKSVITDYLVIPYNAALSLITDGQIGIDSTSGQLRGRVAGADKVYGNGNLYPAFTYSTTTAWTGTTTIPLGTAYVGETWNGAQCFTNAGTLEVQFTDATNNMNRFNASTTVGTVGLTTNNTFTASEKRYVNIGTPASSPTSISCTISKSITAD